MSESKSIPGAKRVILLPDLFPAAFQDPAALSVLNQWRDATIQPVFDELLLQISLKILARAGVTAENLLRWSWWFTHEPHSLFLREPKSSTLAESVAQLAQSSQPEVAICQDLKLYTGLKLGGLRIQSAKEWLK